MFMKNVFSFFKRKAFPNKDKVCSFPDIRTKALLSQELPRIFYFCPDSNIPSWGVGTIYGHVRLLREMGFDASVLHSKAPFKLNWLLSENPICYATDNNFYLYAEDVLVVPEYVAFHLKIRRIQCRKIVLAQNAFFILGNKQTKMEYQKYGNGAIPPLDVNLKEAGYEKAMAVMPHLKAVLETHYKISASIVPYFLPAYFFLENQENAKRFRKKRILIYPKTENWDYDILKTLLLQHLSDPRWKGWEVLELKNKSHRETAELMSESAFFVNVNCYEAFNTSVPEAMASGAICLCYEAFGGRDFLKDGHNAFVFSNNDIYPLLEKLFVLVEKYEEVKPQLEEIRANALEDVLRYKEENTKEALNNFYASMGIPKK